MKRLFVLAAAALSLTLFSFVAPETAAAKKDKVAMVSLVLMLPTTHKITQLALQMLSNQYLTNLPKSNTTLQVPAWVQEAP